MIVNVVSVVIGIFVIGAITSVWYITNPVVYGIIDASEQFSITLDVNRSESSALFTILKGLNVVWGPALVLGILAFMLISSQRQDWRSSHEQPPPPNY